MSTCPYTWFKSLLGSSTSKPGVASELRVTVSKNGETAVDVSLPARCAAWLIEVIPDDVVTKIRNEGIPIDLIQEDLAKAPVLTPQQIFTLEESHRTVKVWLE